MFKKLFILFYLFNELICSMDDTVIDINDILSEQLMPASLFFNEKRPQLATNPDNLDYLSNVTKGGTQHDGTFGNAFSTMGFHRKMIKNYMCSNFLAGQILNEVAPVHFQHRFGVVENCKYITYIGLTMDLV